jgi:hypothetical protein
MADLVSEAKARAMRGSKPGKLPTKTKTVTGAAAVDKTMKQMVAAAKRGEGTLVYKPNKGSSRK